MEVIKVKNLYHTFDGSNYILKDISLSLKKSESIAIMGPSGSGENSIMVTDTIIKLNQGLKASTKFLNKMILI
ncbi:hypothetical protein [Peptoniphilus lacydonensis]|uniref:hypothetical protein n=1 Tax=Peptoniphilus lacydonensis TaxID=1673725 RepID=UPI0008DB0E43|nr:hypothetical protein [Peptoniphilus lacydonensis]MDU5378259.1 hypothetical protein [Peptoniphilus lacydonensis]